MSVQDHRARRLAHRVTELARAEEDVGGDVDRRHARVGPCRPQLGLGVDRDRRFAKQRIAVADPPAALAADDASLVDAVDLVQPPLGAAVAHDDPPVDALVQPAASEEHRPRAPPLSAPVAAARAPALAVQAALVAAHDALPARHFVPTTHRASTVPGPAARVAPRRQPRASVGLVRNVLALADLAVDPRARRSGARRGLTLHRHPPRPGPQTRARARRRERALRGTCGRDACDRHGNDSAGRPRVRNRVRLSLERARR